MVDYDELEPVVDMLAARRDRVRPSCTKNGAIMFFIEFIQDTPAQARSSISPARAHQGHPRDPNRASVHGANRGPRRCCVLGCPARLFDYRERDPDAAHRAAGRGGMPGAARRRHPGDLTRCRRWLWLQRLALPRRSRGGLARIARRTPVRWIEDCRERLSANANCREHHYRITGYAIRTAGSSALDCVATSTPAHIPLSDFVCARSRSGREPVAGTLRFSTCIAVAPLPWPRTSARSCRIAASRVPACALRSKSSWMKSRGNAAFEPYEVRLQKSCASRPDAVPNV